MIQIISEKCINILIIQKNFTNILKTSAVKTGAIKASAEIIVIITVKNTEMQNALNSQITSTKKMKICKTFPKFLIFLKKVLLDVRFGKVDDNDIWYGKNT